MLKNKGGLSIIEVLVATLILLPATLAILQFYVVNMAFSNLHKEKTVAMAHLVNMMERIKCTPFSDITSEFPDGELDGVGDSYAAYVGGYTLKNEHITVSYVDPDSDPLEAGVNVSWQDTIGRNYTSSLVTKRTK